MLLKGILWTDLWTTFALSYKHKKGGTSIGAGEAAEHPFIVTVSAQTQVSLISKKLLICQCLHVVA